MSRLLPWAAGLLFTGLQVWATTPDDTARLGNHMRALRGSLWLDPAEYTAIQSEFLAWLDARVKTGASVASMNQELKSAGILPDWTPSVDEMDRSHAGYVEAIPERAVRGTSDVFVIEARIYKGAGCSVDSTALAYDQESRRRIAAIRAAPEVAKYAYYLSGLDVGGKDSTGSRLVATGWVISNCTSAWNGKRIRIDRTGGTSAGSILARALFAHDRLGDTVAAQIQGDRVTFEYDAGVQDLNILLTPAVATFRIAGHVAVRQSPIALTRAGFIEEWLSMADDPARWGETQALRLRPTVAAAVQQHGFEWAKMFRCGGSPASWEVGVRIRDLEKTYFFRIAGTRARELRMDDIRDDATQSCIEENTSKDLSVVAAELPR